MPENTDVAASSAGQAQLLAGASYKPQHADAIFADEQWDLWFEVHPENYMVQGGPRLRSLEMLRERAPLSLHGVAMNLGGEPGSRHRYLKAFRALVERFQPRLVSEHLAWSSFRGRYFADLLPIALDDAALDRVGTAIEQAQDGLQRQLLIENPSWYLRLPGSNLDEVDFLHELCSRTGCGLLLDINNVYVSSHNLNFDPLTYLKRLEGKHIGEIHLAGHSVESDNDDQLLIDDHGQRVAEAVWALYDILIQRIGPRPTLVEWDNNIPQWAVLRDETERAAAALGRASKIVEAVKLQRDGNGSHA